MSRELGACSRGPAEGRRSIQRLAYEGERGQGTGHRRQASGLPAPRRRGGERAAFSLVEMLIVVAVIAVLSVLLTPAVQGLMGTNGRRGGLNTATAVLEHARVAAIENGAAVYIGFPLNAQDKTNAFSHLIVFRGPKQGEPPATIVPLTRWQRLPNGVFFQAGDGLSSALANRSFASRTLPRLGSEDLLSVPALAFNRFGQLQGVNQEVSLLIGEKIDPAGSWVGSPNNYFQLRIQPLTGRAIVRDASKSP